MKPATEILLSAAFALTPKENWTRNTAARDSRGSPVPINDAKACRFCMVGAVRRAASELGYDSYEARLEEILFNLMHDAAGIHPPMFNDHAAHAEVLEALYKAAELSEASNG